MWAIKDQRTLVDTFSRVLKGLDKGYWITLNSDKSVSGLDDKCLDSRITDFEPKVIQFISELNEYCYGRQFLKKRPGAKLNCVGAFEVGNHERLLHVHIVAGHNGSTNRSIPDIQKFSSSAWNRIGQFKKHLNTRVRVEDIGTVSARIWYMTKQSVEFQRWQDGRDNISNF